MMTAASVAVALASGVILGEYLAQPLKRETRRLEARLAGPRLVGPFRASRRGETRGRPDSAEPRPCRPARRSSHATWLPSYGAAPLHDRCRDLVGAGPGRGDHLGGVAVGDLVLEELVLVVDEHLAASRRSGSAAPTAS